MKLQVSTYTQYWNPTGRNCRVELDREIPDG
jgi:hypothetical protein